ncbi:efflux RND transporter periplasmic adaptor subunit [Fusibacter sp. JL216-2]|uniref:efflux RND transporter periplasmic adaptor subunit n=1 Tax=Fusibacter sp. JL216-2 TaxID=3071453 RepID=UPI003D337905
MRKKIAVIAVSAILMTTLSACGQADAKETVQSLALKEQSVQTILIESGDLDRTLSYNGVLSPVNIVHLASSIPGEIMDVPVQVGDSVNENDVLYKLDKESVERSLRNAQLSLQAAQHQVESMKEQNDLAVKSYERMKALYENPNGAAVSKSQLEQAELQASTAGLESAKVQLSQAKIALEQARDQMNDADMKAPISGVVSVLNIQAGQSIGAGQHVADVINMDKVYVDIQVAENVIGNLKKGEKIQGLVPAVSSELIEGTIDWVSPAADLQTRLFPVRVVFDNPDHLVKPGMFVDVKLNISEASQAIVVPSTAILDRTDGKVVYVSENGVAKLQYVETGFDNGEYTVINSGLEPGDELVIEGQQFIEDGTPLNINGGE